jgi:hypothetical protein
VAKTPPPETSATPASVPVTIVPRITFNVATADFGFRIPEGTVLSFTDPAHQDVLRRRFAGLAAIDFVPADPAQAAQAVRLSIADAQAQIISNTKNLAEIEAQRLTEIDGLSSQRSAIIAEARAGAGIAEGTELTDDDKDALTKFLTTDEGLALAHQKDRVEARIKKVDALVKAARDKTDSTLQVSVANSNIIEAQQRLAQLSKPVVASPGVTVAGPSTTTGEAAT